MLDAALLVADLIEANRRALLTEAAAASYLGVSLQTLRRLRYAGIGPAFVQLSARRLGYQRGSLDDYLAAHTSTSAAA